MSDWKTRPARVEQFTALDGPAREQAIRELANTIHRQSGDLDALNTAVEALSRLGAQAVPAVLPLFEAEIPETRIAAALTLGQIASPLATQPLLGLLGDADPNVAYQAIQALGRIGARDAVPALLKILESGDFFRLFPAMEALALIADPLALPELIDRLDDDLSGELAAQALGACGHSLALVPLAARLAGNVGSPKWWGLMAACEQILSRYSERTALFLELEDALLASIADSGLEVLLQLDLRPTASTASRGVARLLAAAVRNERLSGPRAEAALGRILDIFASLEEGLPPAFMLRAVDTAALGGRVQSLATKQRAVLVQILAQSDSPAAGDLLLQLMRDDDDEVRRLAAQAFPETSGSLPVDALLAFAGSPDPTVVSAVHAASQRLERLDAQRWESLLTHPDPACRVLAARAARWVPDLPFQVLLSRLEGDDDRSVQAALLESLLQRREPITDWLRSHWNELPAGQTALVAEHLEGLDATLELLSLALLSSDIWTRLQAARSCARAPALAANLSAEQRDRLAHDPLPPLRAIAIELTPSDAVGAEQRFEAALLDPEPDVVRAALRALARLPGERPKATLIRLYLEAPERRSILLAGLQGCVGAAARGLAQRALAESPADSAARLLWSEPDASDAKALVEAALRHRRADWLRPPEDCSPDSHRTVVEALSETPWPDRPLQQAVWIEAAAALVALDLLESSHPTMDPWARRALLLCLCDAGSPELCRQAEAVRAQAQQAGLSRLAGLILEAHCSVSR